MGKIRHKIMADLILVLHLAWVVLLLGGMFFLAYHTWYIPYHLFLITGTLLLNLVLGGCPLTWLEEKYRTSWNPETEPYNNSFIAAHLKRVFGIKLTPASVNWALFVVKAVSYYISFRLLIVS